MENKSIKDEIEKEVDDFTQALIERDKQALRYNQGKVQWSLVDYKSIEPMVRVLEYGCLKYSKNNWKKGMPASQIIESMLRHTYKLLEGELVDPESGIEHVGHIQCNAMFLAYVLREKPEYNDLRQD
jgi:uncharacterized protein YuzB (UPF0349 family)